MHVLRVPGGHQEGDAASQSRGLGSKDPAHKNNDLGGPFDIQPQLVELSGRNKSLPFGDERWLLGQGEPEKAIEDRRDLAAKICLVSGV